MPTVTLGINYELNQALSLRNTLPLQFMTFGSNMEIDFKISEVSFNGGVSDRVASGINNTPQRWVLAWSGLTDAQEVQLRGFFSSLCSVDTVAWTPFGETEERLFVATSFTSTPVGHLAYDASVRLTQVFDP